ncbi:MAG TPA: insulinase family protein, partial [Leptospiraceae bacterium]|nr:insulinase family protein [Leptospiraceae bacterium]
LLKKKGISKEELEFAKSNQKGSMAIGHELPENKMMDIAVQEMFFGKYYTMQDKYKIIENITLEELNEFVHRIFSVNRMHLSSIGPVSDRVSKDLDLSL